MKMTIKKRLIKKHLGEMKRLKENLPKKYYDFWEDVTQIHYGFMGRKIITVEEIKDYNKRETE